MRRLRRVVGVVMLAIALSAATGACTQPAGGGASPTPGGELPGY